MQSYLFDRITARPGCGWAAPLLQARRVRDVEITKRSSRCGLQPSAEAVLQDGWLARACSTAQAGIDCVALARQVPWSDLRRGTLQQLTDSVLLPLQVGRLRVSRPGRLVCACVRRVRWAGSRLHPAARL
jgi:hypothetical protein